MIKPRTAIGLLINFIDADFQNTVYKAVHKIACKKNADLFVFTGSFPGEVKVFKHQLNAVYKLVPDFLDGLLIVTSVMGRYISSCELINFVNGYPLPKVCIMREVKGCPSVIIDQSIGIVKLMKHLTDVHGAGKIGYISGNNKNRESRERFQTWQRSLRQFGLNAEDCPAITGVSTSGAAAKAVERMLQKNIPLDALISDLPASDMMNELQKKGLQVPDDLIFSAFDSTDEGSHGLVPVTTVVNPWYDNAIQAAEILFEIINEKKVNNINITEQTLRVRYSCGCLSSVENYKTAESFIETMKDSLLDTHINKKKLTNILTEISNIIYTDKDSSIDFNRIADLATQAAEMEIDLAGKPEMYLSFTKIIRQALSIRNIPVPPDFFSRLHHRLSDLINSDLLDRKKKDNSRLKNLNSTVFSFHAANDRSDLLERLKTGLPGLGIKRAYISLFDKDSEYEEGMNWQPDPRSRTIFAYDEFAFYDLHGRHSFHSQNLLPSRFLQHKKRSSYIVQSLFFMNRQLGHMILSVEPDQTYIVEPLQRQLCLSLQESEADLKTSSGTGKELIPSPQQTTPRWLLKAVHEMELPEHFIKGLPDFIRLSGKSQEHLTRSMRRYYGISPSTLINRLRISAAATILAENQEPILDIFLNLGYNSLSYAERVFKKFYKISPRQYRRQVYQD